MMGGISAREVVQAIDRWTPSDVKDHERKYQAELQDYLDDELNSGGMGLLGGGSGGGVEVSKERGRTNADIAIDDRVSIEMKRNLKNKMVDRLSKQIDKQSEEYEAVIVVACGVDDRDGWRRVQNEYSGSQMGMGLGMGAEVHFIEKPRDAMGKSPGGRDSGGGLLDF